MHCGLCPCKSVLLDPIADRAFRNGEYPCRAGTVPVCQLKNTSELLAFTQRIVRERQSDHLPDITSRLQDKLSNRGLQLADVAWIVSHGQDCSQPSDMFGIVIDLDVVPWV